MKKYIIILLVGGFGIMTGLELKEVLELHSFKKDFTSNLIGLVLYFLMMLVLFNEWIKVLKHEKKNNN